MVLMASRVGIERKCRFTGSADSRYSQFILSRRSSPTLMERSRCCAGAQAKTCSGHKQTPSTYLPDTKPVKKAKDYVVDTYVKPAVFSKIDPQQFGTVPKSSTTHALINMIHSWAKSTDGNGSTTRVVLSDFRKAFDLIDHRVLARKLSSYDIPRSILS